MTSCDFTALATLGAQGLSPYQPGKPVEALQRELGLSDIVKLASNENPLGISDSAKEAILQSMQEGSRYPDGSGFRLKAALSERFDVPAECITLGNGSNDILDLIARGFADSHSEVIYSQYGFAVYALATQSVGAQHKVIPAIDWGHDLDGMLRAITDQTKLIYIANPNNPTGTYVSDTALRRFLENVPKQVLVVLDEAYCEYIDRSDYPDGMSLAKQFDNLIVSRTFSKAWGLAALRVGYCVSSASIADILNRVRHPFNVNTPALAAAEAVLSDEAYLARSIEINRQGMDYLCKQFTERGIQWIPSVGNFICFEAPIDTARLNQMLLERGVIVRPVGNYGMTDHLRVSIGLSSENARFISALDESLSAS